MHDRLQCQGVTGGVAGAVAGFLLSEGDVSVVVGAAAGTDVADGSAVCVGRVITSPLASGR